MSPWLAIVGVTEGGIADLPASARAEIAAATVLIGPERLLAPLRPAVNLPSPLRGGAGGGGSTALQTLIAWTSPLDQMIGQVLARRGQPTVILATGDPNWFGIGATLGRHLDPDEYRLHPAVSSLQLAAARLGWPLQAITTLSLHGRPVAALHPHLTPGNRILMLTSDAGTLPQVRDLLIARGYGGSRLVALADLGAPTERVLESEAHAFAADPGDFYVLALDCAADATAPLLAAVPGLPDDAYRSDGQLTKREVRAATLARLAPYPGALLWDVGAGMGSIGIEWMRASRDARAIAFESDAARIEMIRHNATALGVPGLAIVAGQAPQSLAGAATPDAIFIGGAVADDALFAACWQALRPGGRLVANAVTLEAEAALYQRQRNLGGEILRIDIARLDRVGESHVLRPRLPVTQWAVVKSALGGEAS